MGALGSLVVSLKGDIADFSNKMKSAQDIMKKFSEKTNRVAKPLTTSSEGLVRFANDLNKNYGKATMALSRHNLGLKDTMRIVQGILVSQAFYRIAGSIREATRSLTEFNENLDYAKVTYGALFGNATLAEDFMTVLQEHSINTIFDYDTLTKASKKLLAYGIEYKNLMFIMGGLTDLGAMSGDAEALDRISYAIGQIYAKGTLKAEEMRQLANAYVPIQDIIKKRFNLSEEDLGRVGDLQLPAEEVINAIVDYANNQFGKVGDMAMLTITGLKNRIVDTLKVTGVEVLAPVTVAYKSFLVYVADGLDALRAKFKEGGLGGVFNTLVPDPTKQAIIRQFIANLKNAFMSLVSVLSVISSIAKQFGIVLMNIFNIVGPSIIFVVNAFTAVLKAMLDNTGVAIILRTAILAAAASFAILRAQAIGALVVTALTNAIITLSKALLVLSKIITTNKILAGLLLIAVGLVAIAGASNKANKALSEFFGKFSTAAKPSEVLQEVDKNVEDSSEKLGQFNERFVEGGDNAEEWGNKIAGASKKAKKSLLSFDEVFRLNDNDSAGSGLDDGLDGLLNEINGIGSELGDIKLDIPDFSDYINGFTDNLFGGLKDSLLAKLAVAGLGTLLGKKLLEQITATMAATGASTNLARIGLLLAKGIMGGFIGYGFDAIISQFTDKLWFWLEEKLQLKDGSAEQASFGATLASIIGGGIGMILGGPGGALIGAAIGHFAGGIVGLSFQSIIDKFKKGEIAGFTGIGSGAIAGFFIGGPMGALIGAAIGGFAGFIGDLFWDELSSTMQRGMLGGIAGIGLGGAIGATVGSVGGPLGMLIGGLVGTLIGMLTDKLVTADWSKVWEAFKTGLFGDGGLFGWSTEMFKLAGEFFSDISDAFAEGDWLRIGEDILLGILNGLVGAFTFIIEPISRLFHAIWNAICEIFGIHSPAEEMKPIGENILLGLLQGIVDAIAAIPEYILSVSVALMNAFRTMLGDLGPKTNEWMSSAKESIKGFTDSSAEKLTEWSTNTKERISAWWTNIKGKFDDFRSVSFKDWCDNTLTTIRDWASNVWSSIKSNIGSAVDKVKEFFSADDEQTAYRGATYSVSAARGIRLGHSTGGIFTKEHIARFAEGNKAEMAVPLENASAMQPFVDAIANGITASLAPMLVTAGGGADRQPLYVGTLIADERGLRELERKMEVIRREENRR